MILLCSYKDITPPWYYLLFPSAKMNIVRQRKKCQGERKAPENGGDYENKEISRIIKHMCIVSCLHGRL